MKKNKFIIVIGLLLLCLLCINCSNENDVVISNNLEYINIDTNKIFENHENVLIYQKACDRFNEYIVKNKNGEYQTKLENGKKILISEELFEYLKDNLKYRAFVEKKLQDYELNKMSFSRNSMPIPVPRNLYEYYIFGQFKYIWYSVMGFSQMAYDASVDFLIVMGKEIVKVAYVTLSVALGFIIPVSLDSPLVPPTFMDPYLGPPILSANEYIGYTSIPSGVFPCPIEGTRFYARDRYIVIIDNVMYTRPILPGREFSFKRGDPVFYQSRDAHYIP